MWSDSEPTTDRTPTQAPARSRGTNQTADEADDDDDVADPRRQEAQRSRTRRDPTSGRWRGAAGRPSRTRGSIAGQGHRGRDDQGCRHERPAERRARPVAQDVEPGVRLRDLDRTDDGREPADERLRIPPGPRRRGSGGSRAGHPPDRRGTRTRRTATVWMLAPKIDSANGGQARTSGSQSHGMPSRRQARMAAPSMIATATAPTSHPRQVGQEREERQDVRRVEERLGRPRLRRERTLRGTARSPACQRSAARSGISMSTAKRASISTVSRRALTMRIVSRTTSAVMSRRLGPVIGRSAAAVIVTPAITTWSAPPCRSAAPSRDRGGRRVARPPRARGRPRAARARAPSTRRGRPGRRAPGSRARGRAARCRTRRPGIGPPAQRDRLGEGIAVEVHVHDPSSLEARG